jgi:DNA-3-methyladenine glycosylase
MDDFTFLEKPASEAAPLLLGCILERAVGGHVLRGRIVETEAYDQTDAASHSYRGMTPRTEVMFGKAGRLYVYFTYGMHYCCNIVTGPEGHGSAVLIRAVEPLEGEAVMTGLRRDRGGIELTNGPAKFCQAFAIDRKLNGHDLRREPCRLLPGNLLPARDIVQTTRIGISRGKDVPWRFYAKGNPYVSRP